MSLHFTNEHEWVRLDGDIATVGISKYAAEQLGDVVFVDLPSIGAAFKAKAEMAAVESVKAASEVYAPISGAVTAINEALADAPQMVNEDPENTGWFLKLSVSDADELSHLMDAAAYDAFLKTLD